MSVLEHEDIWGDLKVSKPKRPRKTKRTEAPKMGKVVKVYSLTPFGEEMAKIAKDFERRIRIDELEELRVLIISRIETRAAEFKFSNGVSRKESIAGHNGAIDAYHEVIDLIAKAKGRTVK